MCYAKNRLGLMSLLCLSVAPDHSSTSDDSDNITPNNSCVTNDGDITLTLDGDSASGSNYAITPNSGYVGGND